MFKRIIGISALSSLALGLALAGCEDTGRLVGPGQPAQERVVRVDANGATLITETDPTVGVVSGLIDQNGGALSIGPITLTVPAGAVGQPTTFTINKPANGLKADFTATLNAPNDVGAAGFAQPLTLTFSLASASVGDLSNVKVGWIRPDGSVQFQSTSLNAQNKVVSSPVTHFSGFGTFENTPPYCDGIVILNQCIDPLTGLFVP